VFIDSCFILDEAVEDQVPVLLQNIPNEPMNHMDGKSIINYSLKYEMHLFILF
jgi:hypothetical protein